MRIPLRVKRLFPRVERFAPVAPLIIKPRGAYAMTEALVDTGSPRTTIAPRDLAKMRTIRVEALPPSVPRNSRIGGFVIPAYSLKDVTLTFWDEERNPVRVVLKAMDVLGFSTKAEGIEHIPTILGTDFLEDNKFALYFDPFNKVSYLERKETTELSAEAR
jgi:hypothetical protein